MALELPAYPEHTRFTDRIGDWQIHYSLGRTRPTGALVIRELSIGPASGVRYDPDKPLESALADMKARLRVPGSGINWELLRRLPLGGALRHARAVLKHQDEEAAIAARQRRGRTAAKPLGRPGVYTAPFYRRVSRRYKALAKQRDVVRQLAREFDKPYDTMRGIVARCRLYEYLPPSGRKQRRPKPRA